jgi:hypothetical protein
MTTLQQFEPKGQENIMNPHPLYFRPICDSTNILRIEYLLKCAKAEYEMYTAVLKLCKEKEEEEEEK